MVGVASSIAFAAFVLDAPMPFIVIAFLAAGTTDVMTVPAAAVIGERLPQASRGTAFSFLEGALGVAQVVAALGAGALATAMSIASASALLSLPALLMAVVGLLVVRTRTGGAAGDDDAASEGASAVLVPATPPER
jgi:MFS family permease